MEFLKNPFFLVFFGGILAAYIALRLARNAREGAEGGLEEGDPKKFIRKRRVYSFFGIVFLLTGLSGFGIAGADFYLQNQDLFSFQQVQEIAESPPPTRFPTQPALAPTPTETATATASSSPAPTETATITPSPTLDGGIIGVRVIGNTNYQGLNVRETPSTKARIVARLVNGSEVSLLNEPTEEADGFIWQRIQLEDGTVGWVVSFYLLEESLETTRIP